MIVGRVIPRDLGLPAAKPVKKSSSGQNKSEFEDALVTSLTSAVEQVEDEREKNTRKESSASEDTDEELTAEDNAEDVAFKTAAEPTSHEVEADKFAKKLNIEA